MRSSKKGNHWYFGMKVHIGVDATSGLAHTAGVTTRSVHDSNVMDNLIREMIARSTAIKVIPTTASDGRLKQRAFCGQ